MRPSYPASVALRRGIGALARCWPAGLLHPRRERAGRSRIVAEITVTIAGRDLIIPAANTYHLKRFRDLAAGKKEPHTQAWITETLKPGDVFLDIGANVGVFSALAAIVAPEARIFAFEPEPQSCAALAEMVAINKLPVTVFAQAIGSRTGASLFHLNGMVAPGYSDHQLHRPVGQNGQAFAPVASIGTVAMSIDDLLMLGAIPCPSHVKIDVDGQEDEILDGACSLSSHGRWIAVECMAEKRAAMMRKLLSRGFDPSPRYTDGNMIIAQRRGS